MLEELTKTVGLPTTSTPRKRGSALPSVAVNVGLIAAGLEQSNAAGVPATETSSQLQTLSASTFGLHQCNICAYSTKIYSITVAKCRSTIIKMNTYVVVANFRRILILRITNVIVKNVPFYIVIAVAGNLHLSKTYRDTSCRFIRTRGRSNAASVIKHFPVN